MNMIAKSTAAVAVAPATIAPALALPKISPALSPAPSEPTVIETLWRKRETLQSAYEKAEAEVRKLEQERDRRLGTPHPLIVYGPESERDGIAWAIRGNPDSYIYPHFIEGAITKVKFPCDGTYSAVQLMKRLSGPPKPLSARKAALLKRLKERLRLSQKYTARAQKITEEIGLKALYDKQEKITARQGDIELRIERAQPTTRADVMIKLRLYDKTYCELDRAPRELVRDLRWLIDQPQPAA